MKIYKKILICLMLAVLTISMTGVGVYADVFEDEYVSYFTIIPSESPLFDQSSSTVLIDSPTTTYPSDAKAIEL